MSFNAKNAPNRLVVSLSVMALLGIGLIPLSGMAQKAGKPKPNSAATRTDFLELIDRQCVAFYPAVEKRPDIDGLAQEYFTFSA